MDDRATEVREVMRAVLTSDAWEAAIDEDVPPPLRRLFLDLIAAYRRGDLEWVLEHADPDVEIIQVPEIPDARTYRGHEGFVDALLDWPRQWEDFRMEPRRIFAVGDDWLIMDAIHHGRPRSMDLEVAAEIVFATRWREERLTHWHMFLTVEEALGTAAKGGAHDDDDRAGDLY